MIRTWSGSQNQSKKKNGSKTTAELFSGAHGRLGTGRSQDTPWPGQRLKRINHSHSSTRTYVHLEASVWRIRMFLDWSTYKKKKYKRHTERALIITGNQTDDLPAEGPPDGLWLIWDLYLKTAPDAFLMCSSKKEADDVWLISSFTMEL